MKFLLLIILVLASGCSTDDQPVLIPRAPSDDLSVRRFFVVIASSRLIGEREALPNDPTTFVTIDLVEHEGIVRAFQPVDPAGVRCTPLWVPDLRASEFFRDHPKGDRAGWFRGLCEGEQQGQVYDLDGSCFGTCRGGNLPGFPVSIEGEQVRVHLPKD